MLHILHHRRQHRHLTLRHGNPKLAPPRPKRNKPRFKFTRNPSRPSLRPRKHNQRPPHSTSNHVYRRRNRLRQAPPRLHVRHKQHSLLRRNGHLLNPRKQPSKNKHHRLEPKTIPPRDTGNSRRRSSELNHATGGSHNEESRRGGLDGEEPGRISQLDTARIDGVTRMVGGNV